MIEESKTYMIPKEPQMASHCPPKVVLFGFEIRRNATIMTTREENLKHPLKGFVPGREF